MLLIWTVPARAQLFGARMDFRIDDGAWELAVGDFDEDGTPDLAVAGNSGVSVMLGAWYGMFHAPAHYGTGESPRGVVTADFNGDDHADLAVANRMGASVSVLPGNGDDTFQAPVTSPVGVLPHEMATGDFDAAGHLDLAVANWGGDTVSAGLGCLPATGTLPFDTRMTVTLTNHYAGCSRRIAARIDVLPAGGQSVSRWRAGFANVAPESSFQAGWAATIPALAALLGEDHLTIVAEDVTPYPYNEPPYPRAGDTGTGRCSVTGAAP